MKWRALPEMSAARHRVDVADAGHRATTGPGKAQGIDSRNEDYLQGN